MRARLVLALGLSVGVLATIQACGSDGGAGANNDRDGGGGAGAGHKGTGGSSGSGAREGGTSGTAGAGGTAALPCDTSACDSLLAPIQSVLGTLLTSCCQDDKTCGIDTSALGVGTGPAACVDPSTLTTTPPPPILSDGGIIFVPDGGAPIQLDKNCPAIVGESATPNTPPYFTLPGCCRPNGRCGGSTHTLLGAGTSVPLVCESYDDVAAGAATASFASDVIVPDDPVIHCSYTAGPTVDSGAPPPPPPPDASITPPPDASTEPDASTAPPRPDAGPSHDAATHADH